MPDTLKDAEQLSENCGDSLWVATHRDTAMVRVKGRGSFKVGPALKLFGASAVKGGCRRFIFDMDECSGMDSTFMGVLAGLAMRLRNEAGGAVIMMNLSPKIAALLETLGLDRLIEMHPAGRMDGALKKHLAGVVDVTRLEASCSDRKMTMETMLAAHQDLVKADPENLPKFKNVMAYLSADLKQFEGR